MRHTHLRSRLFGVPLLLTEDYGAAVMTALADRLDTEPMMGDAEVQRYHRPSYETTISKETGVATMPIVGGMVHRGGFMEAMSGLNSYASMQNDLQSLLDERSVRGVLLDIDSGGGEAAGLQELADFITTANQLGDKPIWAIANTSAGSAAYWLASAADRLYMAPGARVGSIGVYMQHQDVSGAMKKRGIVTSFIYAGKHKIDGNMFEPLPESVREERQAEADELWHTFASAVAAGRGMSVEDVMSTEARMYGPQDAIDLGLADGEGTLGEVLTAFSNYVNKPSSGGIFTGVTMNERATYTQADFDRARADGHAAGLAAGTANLNAQIDAARLDERKKVVTALGTVFPDDKRMSTFAEAINDGGSLAFASKFASQAEAPKEAPKEPVKPAAVEKTFTQADVDKMMSDHAAGLKSDDAQNSDAKAKRLAELTGAAKAHNKAMGYGTH